MTDKNSNQESKPQASEGFAHGVAPGVKWAVIIMGIMLIIGMIVVFSTIIYRTVKLSSGKTISKVTKTEPYPDITLPLAQNGEVTSLELDGNRLAFKVVEDTKTTIYLVDVKRGQVLSKVVLSKGQ